ncbi:olfactory receptor 146-like [Cynoglossus semilaevis]|uniref:olfactory receptor 146-like n=1 Tax=Cynoglossus semilaevis TaxID=244447 RepID=UPI00049665F5|nr:olfactory receptor 146-like [Cynoglossus semilaevis]
MMENYTYNSFTLQMEGFKVSEEYMIPLFFFFLSSYIFLVITNVFVLVLVVGDKNFHQPMYLLFCNLSVSDLIGGTCIIPRLLADLVLLPPERFISYYECVAQAFSVQLFGTTSHTVLMIMAFDRYVAICDPLRYGAIMTKRMIIKLTVSAWAVPFVLVGILIGLSVRLSRCRTLISGPFCDNASLFKLSCESVFINNVYGLTYTVVLFVFSLGCITITYIRILLVCLTKKNKSLSSKALKTCSTHLVVYVIMMFSGNIQIILHRFPQYKDYVKVSGILFTIVPGSLNTVIYGVQSKEIRQFFSNKLQCNSLKPDKI